MNTTVSIYQDKDRQHNYQSAKTTVRFSRSRDEGLTGRFIYWIAHTKIPGLKKYFPKFCWSLLGAHYQFYSKTLRKVLRDKYGVEVGMYTHGGVCIPGRFPRGTRIGRYCSIAVSASVHNANHPMNTKSSHAFFYNPKLGYVEQESIKRVNLRIGNDVWIGENAVILSSCTEIGDGAVIGAGAVVSRDIPPYAVAIGNPARVVRHRFEKDRIERLLEEQWWHKEIDEIVDVFDEFTCPLEGDEIR